MRNRKIVQRHFSKGADSIYHFKFTRKCFRCQCIMNFQILQIEHSPDSFIFQRWFWHQNWAYDYLCLSFSFSLSTPLYFLLSTSTSHFFFYLFHTSLSFFSTSLFPYLSFNCLTANSKFHLFYHIEIIVNICLRVSIIN